MAATTERAHRSTDRAKHGDGPLWLRLGRAAAITCALAAAAGGDAAAAAGGGGAKASRFRGLAYNGDVLPQWWGNVVLDVESCVLPDFEAGEKLPTLLNHGMGIDRSYSGACWPNVGFIDAASFTGKGALKIEGQFLSNPTASQVMADAADGYPWELSIAATGGALDFIAEGSSVKVNGRTVAGPVHVYRNATLREVSFVQLGADPNTDATLLAASALGAHIDRDALAAGALGRTIMAGTKNKGKGQDFEAGSTASGDAEGAEGTETTATAAGAAPTAAPATLAQLKAMKGADSEFVVKALEAGWSQAQAAEQLVATLADRLAKAGTASDERVKQLEASHKDAVEKLESQLKTAKGAAGIDPVPGAGVQASGGAGVGAGADGKIAGLKGNNPEGDWAASPALQATWKEHGGKTAFLRFAKMQAKAGEGYDIDPFA